MVEERILVQIVGVGGALKQLDLGQNLKLLALLIEVDQFVLRQIVRIGGVYHGQIGEKCAQIWNRAMRRLCAQILYKLLQMSIRLIAGRIRILGRTLTLEHLAQSPGIVVLGTDARELREDFHLRCK